MAVGRSAEARPGDAVCRAVQTKHANSAALVLLLLFRAHGAAAQPSFSNCRNTTGMFNLNGSTQSQPCPQRTVSVTPAGSNFLFACFGDGAVLCDGDGSGPSPASCRSVGKLGCTSYIFDLVHSAPKDKMYVACYTMVLQCDWDNVRGEASSCTAMGSAECPGAGYERGVEITGDDLVVGCYSSSTEADAGLLVCPLTPTGSAVWGRCTKRSNPCGVITGQSSFATTALSLDAAGGISIGCGTDGTVYCANFQTTSGATNCFAPAPPSPCSETTGFAQLASGTAVGCHAGGFRLCSDTPPSRSPVLPPTEGPSTRPSTPPTAGPTAAPTALPSGGPSAPPSGNPSRTPSVGPSSPPSAAPSRPPTPMPPPSRSPLLPPSKEPSAAPSLRPAPPPSAPPSEEPSGTPSKPPEPLPTGAPALPPSAAPNGTPTLGPVQPTQPPTAAPTNSPSRSPSEPPSPRPAAAPTGSPRSAPSPPGAPPRPPSGPSKCGVDEFWDPSGKCVVCSAELVADGCPPELGGFPGPAADGASCVCNCRFFWTGRDCSICPAGLGGLDCDRCAIGDAEPPQCEMPLCADTASLPAEVATECGGGAREVALEPALHHKGVPALVTISAESPGQPPQLSLPDHVPAQQLGGGALAVRGAELQLSQWLRLRIVPAGALTHSAPVTVTVRVRGSGCRPVSGQFSVRCPAPAPRVSGALPAAAVPEGGEATVPCALAELAHMEYPFSVHSSPPGVVSYDHHAELCTVRTAGLPPNWTTAVVTVSGPGATVPLPLHIDVNPPGCGSGARMPLYVQLPPSGKGYESFGTIALDGLNGSLRSVEVVGESRGVQVHRRLGNTVRVTASSEAAEGTLYVRLLYSAGGEQCAQSHPVRTFWGPGIVGPAEHVRQAVGRPFVHVLRARAIASVGSLPWCPEPVLRLAQQPGGLQLNTSGSEWVLSGAVRSPGIHLVYISATDCRGGSARIRVELYGVAGTELGPLPDTAYLEDTPLRVPLPRVLSTAQNLTLSVAPRLDAQLHMGTLRAKCPTVINVTQDKPGLALALAGPSERLGECSVTLAPAPNGCDTLHLVWRAAGRAEGQLLPAVCGPDPPVATPLRRLVRWSEYVEAPISSLAYSVDHDGCLNITTAVNTTDPWLNHTGTVIGGYAPREEVTQCQQVNTYTCRTNLSAATRFCATSLPDARMHVASETIDCAEDTPCWLGGHVRAGATELSRNDTLLSLVFFSSPPVLVGLRFNASPADAPEVRPSGTGEVRAEGSFERLWLHLAKALAVAAPDFAGTVNVSVRGAVGTAVGEAGPITIRFAPVNDAPRCNDSGGCEGVTLSCGLFGGDEEDLGEHYWDVDDEELRYGANDTSFGVRVEGGTLSCSSFLALLAFYGLPFAGSARVFAVDPSGAVSPVLKVEVVYELTYSETVAVLALTIAASVYGTFLLLFRPGAVAAYRGLRHRATAGSAPGGLSCRVGRAAAAQLQAACLPGVGIYEAGCGLWWLRDAGGIAGLAAGTSGGEAAVKDCGVNLLIGVQAESQFDPGHPLLCAVVSPKRLGLGGAPSLSVLHADPEAALKLCLRLRHKADSSRGGLVWAAGLTRLAAACGAAGPDLTEYSGTAQQVTEFAHMQRVVGPEGCTSELVWTLHEGRSDRPLLGGAIPIGTAGDATLCGGEEAASPKASGPAAPPAAAPAAGPVGEAVGGLSEPLLGQQQQQQTEAALPDQLAPTPLRAAAEAQLLEMELRMEEMERRVRESEQKADSRARAAEREAQKWAMAAEQKVQAARMAAASALDTVQQQRSGGPLLGVRPAPLLPPPPPVRRTPPAAARADPASAQRRSPLRTAPTRTLLRVRPSPQQQPPPARTRME